jgi:serine/threonine protein kinase
VDASGRSADLGERRIAERGDFLCTTRIPLRGAGSGGHVEAVLVNDQAGRYAIIDELGTGGMGGVYRALDRTTNRTVAFKQLKSSSVGPKRRMFEACSSANITRWPGSNIRASSRSTSMA